MLITDLFTPSCSVAESWKTSTTGLSSYFSKILGTMKSSTWHFCCKTQHKKAVLNSGQPSFIHLYFLILSIYLQPHIFIYAIYWRILSFHSNGTAPLLAVPVHTMSSIILTVCSKFGCRQLVLLLIRIFTVSRKEWEWGEREN